jgi:hypothetical protein
VTALIRVTRLTARGPVVVTTQAAVLLAGITADLQALADQAADDGAAAASSATAASGSATAAAGSATAAAGSATAAAGSAAAAAASATAAGTAQTATETARDVTLAARPTNLLTAQQASFEAAGTAGWAAAANCTIARSTAQAASGAASLAVTANATAVANGYMNPGIPTASAVAVAPGRTYTAVLSSRAATVGRSFVVTITWYTAALGWISGASSTQIADNASGWTEARVTAIAPATAAFAIVSTAIYAPADTEVHYVDKVGLWEGAGGAWVNGGERLDVSTLGSYWDETAGRRRFDWDTNNNRWQMTYGDTGWRDVTASCTGVSSGNVYVRRHGNMVSIRLAAAALTAGTGTLSLGYALPAGFTNAGNMVGVGMRNNNATAIQTFALLSNTLYWVGELPVGATSTLLRPTVGVDAHLVFQTSDAWPTALPGSASGSIPAP